MSSVYAVVMVELGTRAVFDDEKLAYTYANHLRNNENQHSSWYRDSVDVIEYELNQWQEALAEGKTLYLVRLYDDLRGVDEAIVLDHANAWERDYRMGDWSCEVLATNEQEAFALARQLRDAEKKSVEARG